MTNDHIEFERARQALAYIPSDDQQTWRNVGMALKAQFGEEAWQIFDDWSGQSDNYDGSENRARWRSFKTGGGIGAGTFYHLAKENGWRDDGTHRVPDPAILAAKRLARTEHAARERAKAELRRANAAKKATALCSLGRVPENNPYCERKGIQSTDTLSEIEVTQATALLGYGPSSSKGPLRGRCLLVPVKISDSLATVQLIDGEGRKHFLAGGAVSGGYWASQPLPEGDGKGLKLLIGEGIATVLSAHEATTHVGVAAMANSNLPTVAQNMRKLYPQAHIVLLADLDKNGAPDRYADEAAHAVGGTLAVPDFGPDRRAGQKDINDMAQARGHEAVARAIEAAEAPEIATIHRAVTKAERAWLEPQPLSVKIEPEPYPVDALPDGIRSAIEDVAGFVKAPLALVAASALGTLSLASQAIIDVHRAELLRGPSSLFLLTIADSGERKTSCDGHFASPIREFQKAQAEALKSEIERYTADFDAWTAERDGILAALKDASKKAEPTQELRGRLAELQAREPKRPRVPILILGDETPENLAWRLHDQWPSAGIMSTEAGVVLGSHGMGAESVMRNLSLFNILWDGGELSIGRRSSESFTLRGARLTVGLQVQEATFREFCKKSGGLARGTGFFARFLMAWPQSTQGTRFYTEPSALRHLQQFQRRIGELLRLPPPIQVDGTLEPSLIKLSPSAKQRFIGYHDAIEAELTSGGELFDVRDVASKTADNAARLASLFQFYETGPGSDVSEINFDRASRIAAWHLNESRRFFGELALPAELSDAVRLETWLLEYCRRQQCISARKNHVRQHGPLRDGKRLTVAIQELAQLDRLRLATRGRQELIELNPALTEVPA